MVVASVDTGRVVYTVVTTVEMMVVGSEMSRVEAGRVMVTVDTGIEDEEQELMVWTEAESVI